MARDLTTTIRFIGDASQLIATYNQIGRSSQALAAEIKTISTANLSSAINLSKYPKGTLQGEFKNPRTGQSLKDAKGNPLRYNLQDTKPFVDKSITEVDLLNKTLRTTHDLYIRAADGSKIFAGQVSQEFANLEQVMGAEKNLQALRGTAVTDMGAVTKRLVDARQAYQNLIGSETQALSGIKQQISGSIKAIDSLRDKLNAAGRDVYAQQRTIRNIASGATPVAVNEAQARDIAAQRYAKAQQAAALARSQYARGNISEERLTGINQNVESTRSSLAAREAEFAAARDAVLIAEKEKLAGLKSIYNERRSLLRGELKQLDQLLVQEEAAIQRLLAAQSGAAAQAALNDVKNIRAQRDTLASQFRSDYKKLQAERQAGLNAPVPPSGLATYLGSSKGGQKALYRAQRLGFDLNDNAIAKNAQITEDAVHGTKSLNATLLNQQGVLKTLNLEWDKEGNIITRFGGHLSGLQNALRQTINNFQKVIYWTVATTAVIGTLGLVSSSITGIVELDKSLQRFAITAQLSSSETKNVFGDLAQVAFDTATPLNELVSAADDIALATRRAGQTTAEWRGEILDLSKAVGILTNLTGLDTVQATDLLTSTMKQLNLRGTDLITILNKVTAVAGGQSTAIADIVTGLGNMAEAAQQSGLSIDQTIGTVQVLSQVTAKSSKEVATAFKNLTGSLDSPGATKVLTKYNISLKDAQGNLKNILDVYKEVNKAIQEGRIAAGDVKGVVKALAGGPRRAPDASALLGAVNQIDAVTQRSLNATNQALVANAKILDTIQAKITQLGVKFQSFVFGKFGAGVREAATNIVGVLETLLSILERVPSGAYAASLQFAGLVLVLKLISTGGKFVVGALREFAETLSFVGAQAAATAGEVGALNKEIAASGAVGGAAAGATGIGGKLSLASIAAGLKSKAGRGALIAGGVGAAGAAAGIGLGLDQSLGANLSLAGTAGLFVPIPQVKALGAALLIAGTAIELFGKKTADATKEVNDSNQTILASLDAYQEAQQSIKDFTDQQNDALQTYKALNVNDKSRKANADLIAASLEQYGEATKGLADANAKLQESFKGLGNETQIAYAKLGQIPSADLKTLISQTSDAILKAQALQSGKPYTPFNAEGPKLTPTPSAGISGVGATAVSEQQTGFYYTATGTEKTFEKVSTSLDSVALKSERVLELFDSTGKVMTGSFLQTAETVDTIKDSLTKLAGGEDDINGRAHVALTTFTQLAAQVEPLAKVELFSNFQETLLQSRELVGDITHDMAVTGKANLDILKQLFALSLKLPQAGPNDTSSLKGVLEASKPTGLTQQGLQQKAIDLLTTRNGQARTSGLYLDEATELLKIFQQLGIISTEINLSDTAQVEALSKVLGIQIELTGAQKQQLQTSESIVAAEEVLGKLGTDRATNLENLAKKSQQIQADYVKSVQDANQKFASKDITSKQRDALIAQARAIRDASLEAANAVNTSQAKIDNFFLSIAGNQEVLNAYTARLAQISGLQDIAGKTAQDAALELNAWIDGLGLTTKAAASATALVLGLNVALASLPKYKQVIVAVTTLYSEGGRTGSGGKDVRSQEKLVQALKEQRQAEKNGDSGAKAAIDKILKEIQNLLGNPSNYISSLSGGGGLGGGGSKAKGPGLDVSELDLPDEIANAANRNALIQEAIKRAKALQNKIPGANAEAKNDVVELLKGTQRILEVRGLRDDLLRKALEELAAIEKKKLDFETKADTIRRIRVGSGDFSAIANVPLNTKTGVSIGGANQINVTLGVNGQILTPAQLAQLADLVAAAIKRQLGA